MATPYLGDATRVKAVLNRYGIRARKKYGQNFLIDASVLRSCADATGAGENDVILEIGPGIGSLTQFLCVRAKKVIAVEIDEDLLPVLADTLADFTNAEVIHGDILKTDIREIAVRENDGRDLVVAANLPYYITTPILMHLIESKAPISDIVLMMQSEVADRILAKEGTPEYGALSLAVQYYAKVDRVREVMPSSFFPSPNVTSTVLHLERYRKPPVAVKDETLLFRLIRAAFNQRRKTLANAVANFDQLSYSREDVQTALVKIDSSPDIRGEKLSLLQFAALADALS